MKNSRHNIMETLRLSLRALKRSLRSPSVIVGEIVALALAGMLGASLPQAGTASVESLVRLHESGPLWTALVKVFALDHVFRSAWFLTLTVLATASLWIVTVEQVRRLRVAWTQRPSPAHFQSAPFRVEFERPARRRPSVPCIQLWTAKRLGLAGAAVLHVGLLLVILAAFLRGLFATDAAVDLIEGETLPLTAAAWAAQFPGLLGQPFHLDGAVTLNAVKAVRYPSGDLRDLKVELAVQGRRGVECAELAVNHDLKAGGGRMFLGSDFGPAALLEWQGPGGASKREATMLTAHGRGDYEGVSAGPNGLRAYLRAGMGSNGAHPNLVEVRVMKDGGLLFTGAACVGQTVAFQTGERLVLHGTPFWARLRGSRDAALWLAYAGFALVLTGVVFIFTLVKVDGCIAVTPVGERERVLVALKPQRFAPLFAERFQQIVRDEGGPVEQEERSEAAVRPSPAIALAPGMPHAQPPCGMPVGQPLAAAARGLAVWTWLLSCLLFLAGCQRSSLSQARQLVERYNRVVAEAYRRGDVKLIDPVVGPNEGKKLTGLIGVRLDLGMTLDSQMLALEVTGVQKAKDELRVQTRERWRYRDRKIGTGEQVGEESLDSYEMLYIFKKSGKDWLVDEIKFTSAPQVGRKRPTWLADRRELHGLSSQTNPAEERHP